MVVFLPSGPVVRGIVIKTVGMTGDGIVEINDQFVYRPGPLSAGIVIDQFLIGDDLLVAVIPDDVQSQAFDLVVSSEEAFCPGGAAQADFEGYGFRGGFLEHFLLVTLGTTPGGEYGKKDGDQRAMNLPHTYLLWLEENPERLLKSSGSN